MFEATPQPESQDKKLESLLPQMKTELEARYRGALSARQNPNPYDLIDATIDSRDLPIRERLQAKNDLIAHMRLITQPNKQN